MNHVYAPYRDEPAPLSRAEQESRVERHQERYDAAFAEAMQGSDEFWRDIDVDAILAAARKAVHTLGLSPQERHLLVFRAVASEAGRFAEQKADS